jgi:hypothetical protein
MAQPKKTYEDWLAYYLDLAAKERVDPGDRFSAKAFAPRKAAVSFLEARGQTDPQQTVFTGATAEGARASGMVNPTPWGRGGMRGWTAGGAKEDFRRQAAENMAEGKKERREGEPTPRKRRKRGSSTTTLNEPNISIRDTGTGGGGDGEYKKGKAGTQEILEIQKEKTQPCKGTKTWDPVTQKCKYPDDKTRGKKPKKKRPPKLPREKTDDEVEIERILDKRRRRREKEKGGGGSCG